MCKYEKFLERLQLSSSFYTKLWYRIKYESYEVMKVKRSCLIDYLTTLYELEFY
jgi:hypothetical protein